MASIANLIVTLSANVANFTSGMDKASKEFDKQAKSWNNLAGDLSGAGATLSGISAGILGIAAGAAYAADGVQKAMNTIRVGTGATGEDLAALGESFKTVASSVPNNFAQVSTAIADVNTRMGLTGPALEGTATQFLNLARITGGDVAESIRTGTRVLGDWGIASDQSSQTMDYLFRVSQSTGIGFSDLAQQVVTFGGPLRQMGFDFETSAALMGKFEKEGVNAELVMGSLRIGLARMAKEGITDSRAALEALTTQIQNAQSPTERVRLAMELFGAKAGPDMAAAIYEGRFQIDELVSTLQGSNETINKAAEDSKSFADRWGEVKNQVLLAVEPIGVKLLQALQGVMPYVTSFISALGAVVEWFAGLPAPVLAAVGAIAGLAVAIGPALLAAGSLISAITAIGAAVAPLAAVLGVSVAALGGWAAAIAAALAALVALGVWVYDNWESIKATVLQAWEGITEMWSSAWSAIGEMLSGVFQWLDELTGGALSAIAWFVTTLWDQIVTDWTNAWTGITTALDLIWNGLKTAAITVWDAIVGAVSGAMTWLADNVPGMDKLLTLDKAWEGAKKVESAHKDLTEAVGQTAAAVGKNDNSGVRGAVGGLTGGLKKAKKSLEERYAELKKQRNADEEWNAFLRKNEGDAKALSKALDDYESKSAKDAEQRTKNLVEEFGNLAAAQDIAEITMTDLSDIAIPSIVTELSKVESPIIDAKTAMEQFGLTSAAELHSATTNAQLAYDALVASDEVTQFQKDSAYIKLLQAMAAEAEQTTGKVPADLQKALDDMNAKASNTSTGLPNLKQQFDDVFTASANVVRDTLGGAINNLAHGDLSSFKDLGNMVSSLKNVFLDNLVTPWLDAITGPQGLIEKGINVLLDKLFDLGRVTSTLFGGGAAGAAGGAGGAIGGAAGGGSAAGGALSGISSFMDVWGGVIGGVISGLGSYLGAMRNEGTLNAIEESTRYTKMYTGGSGGENGHNILTHTGYIHEYMGYLLDDVRGTDGIRDAIRSIRDAAWYTLGKIEMGGGMLDLLRNIDGNTHWMLAKLEDMLPSVQSISAAMSGSSGTVQINLTINGQTTSYEANLSDAVAFNFSV